jgi:hypothetical protein
MRGVGAVRVLAVTRAVRALVAAVVAVPARLAVTRTASVADNCPDCTVNTHEVAPGMAFLAAIHWYQTVSGTGDQVPAIAVT